MPGAQFKELIRYIDLRTTTNIKKYYWAHLVVTLLKFLAQILQCGRILNIVIPLSLIFCSFGKAFCLERLCLKVKQSPCNLWMKQKSVFRHLVPTASVPHLPKLPGCVDTGSSQSTFATKSCPSMGTRQMWIQPQTLQRCSREFSAVWTMNATIDIPHLSKNKKQSTWNHPVDQPKALSCQAEPSWLCHTPQEQTQREHCPNISPVVSAWVLARFSLGKERFINKYSSIIKQIGYWTNLTANT